MTEYWPWWLGALGLGGVSILYLLLIGRLLGVSGSWAKVVAWKENREQQKAAETLVEDTEAMENAFMAETLAEFGEDAIRELQAEKEGDTGGKAADIGELESATPWTAHLVFLLSMFLGAFLVAWFNGQFELRLDLSDTHTRIFGSLWEVWLALLIGGMMVGFGTQMAGGCTSGHGLSGCARLLPASLLATAVFMASAIFLSLLMEVMIR
ncbi:MAG TPA: hypothetical protein ENI93_01495 [Gammaproteobacteria bacterium]|nr:hypothetical protein [Gammaproteobacteria bacterium]